jgi:hypothetical protein
MIHGKKSSIKSKQTNMEKLTLPLFTTNSQGMLIITPCTFALTLAAVSQKRKQPRSPHHICLISDPLIGNRHGVDTLDMEQPNVETPAAHGSCVHRTWFAWGQTLWPYSCMHDLLACHNEHNCTTMQCIDPSPKRAAWSRGVNLPLPYMLVSRERDVLPC